MAHYLIVDDARRILYETRAKSVSEAIEEVGISDPDDAGLAFDVYRVAGPPMRVKIHMETVRKVIVE